jgi:hypothetical protein
MYADAEDLFSGQWAWGLSILKSLDKVKYSFKVGAKHEIRDEARTSFWLDWWLGDAPLKDSFASLFAICESEDISIDLASSRRGCGTCSWVG